MAIVINSQPADYRLTRDPLVFRVTGDQYVITAGVKHQYEFVFTTEPAIGSTLTIESAFIAPGTGKTFTFVDAVPSYVFDGENIRIRSASLNVTLETWIDQSLIPGLMADPNIAENYEINRFGTSVIITALDFGPTYNLTDFTPSGFAVAGPAPVQGVIPVYREDYFIRARVNLETAHESNIYDRSVWFYFRPDETGQINADLSTKLDELFDWTPMLAANSSNVRRTAELRRFYVEWQEKYADGESAIRRSSRRNCMKGASRLRNITISLLSSMISTQSSSFLSPIVAQNNAERIVHIGDVHHWFFVARWPLEGFPGSGPVKPRFRVFYQDGSIETSAGNALNGYSTNQLWAINCGFVANGLHQLSAEIPYAYEVEIIDEGFSFILALPIRFRLRSYGFGGDNRIIRFINRFGVTQTRVVYGNQILEANPSRESMRRSRSIPLLASEADEFSHSITESSRVILGSGTFSDWDSDEVLDLLMSPMHEISEENYLNNTFIPATILNKADVLRSYDNDGGSFRAISIEFKLNQRR